MSLKAKIEAVIYAADEPVTLAQLAAIFAPEALQGALEFSSAASLPFDDTASANAALRGAEQSDAGVQEAAEDETSQPQTDSPATSVEQPALPMEESDAKKKTRLRDREARLAIQRIIEELIAEYAGSERGMEIREIAGGYRIATKAEYHDAVRSFVKSLKPQMKLSLQALETLAVIAYKQPITAPEISEIRGVDTSGVLGSLMARKLIATAGRKQVIGRPILYKTTKEFLLRFGLKDVGELPSIEEFEKMAADMAEPEQEEALWSQALQGTGPVEPGNETVSVTEQISAGGSGVPEEENGATP